MKVNKNTVSKAYRQLHDEGLVRLAPGRRASVARMPARPDRKPEKLVERQVKTVLSPLLREARLLGIAPARILDMVTNEIASFSLGTRRRVYLVECNRLEAQQYARDITDWLGIEVEWKLLDDLPSLACAPSDVCVVPYYHLDDVTPHLPGHQIAGIHVAPDPEALFTLIEAAQRGGVVLICGNAKSAERFRNLFQYYAARGIRITHHGDVAGVKAFLADAKTIFATPVAFASVERQLHAKPIPFAERIDPQSLHSLRVLLSQTARGTTREPGAKRGASSRRTRDAAPPVVATARRSGTKNRP